MTSISILKAGDLKPEERAAAEKLVGRSLDPNEAISLDIFRPHPAPAGEVRRKAATRLSGILDRRAEKVRDIPEDEIEAVLDEALEQFRSRAE